MVKNGLTLIIGLKKIRFLNLLLFPLLSCNSNKGLISSLRVLFSKFFSYKFTRVRAFKHFAFFLLFCHI